MWRARPDFLAYDIRDLPSRFAAAQRAKGMPVLTWTVPEPSADRARAAEHASQIIYESGAAMSGEPVVARLAPGVASFAAEDWDRCAGGGRSVPQPRLPLRARGFGQRDRGDRLAAAADRDRRHRRAAGGGDAGLCEEPLAWANMCSIMAGPTPIERAGGDYYPKLQIAVPFTPVPGRRLLARDAGARAGPDRGGRAGRRRATASPRPTPPSSRPRRSALFEQAGWLIRADSQFHWLNEGYASFDDFLATLSSRKRKAIRKERARGGRRGWRSSTSAAPRSSEAHWDAFWAFYQDTGARKWGQPYLTRAFFSLLGERMATGCC